MDKQARIDWLPDRVVFDMVDALGIDGEALPVEDLVRRFQAHAGLKVDGWPGTRTAQALYGSGKPIPKGRAQLARQFGVIKWRKLNAAKPKDRRVRILNGWGRANVRRFRLHTGQDVRLHADIGDEFVALFRLACVVSGYTPDSVQTYNPRVIGGTSRLSIHTYGLAADFDPRDNPWGGVREDGSPSLIRQHMLFAEVWEWAGWTWGGRWRSGEGDDMHVQRVGV